MAHTVGIGSNFIELQWCNGGGHFAEGIKFWWNDQGI